MSWGTPRRLVRPVTFVLGACLLSPAAIGCAPSPSPTDPPPTTTPAPSTTVAPAPSGPAAEVVDLTNAERAAAGCGPVTAHPQLTRAAQLHAEDMADNDYFSHDSLDGRAPWDRAREQGYTGGIGENIAMGQPTARVVVDGWMASSGHRSNIENCTWRHIGVGYDDGAKTWVQLFGT